ncbi:MAG: hypothetical protein NZM38_03465 [Cytophagales bacterium]|nr:hypothetical protein [Cytophagales bacterium]MDW8383810.1 hypothetical protein [Flammeovirgaceae bacterium]
MKNFFLAICYIFTIKIGFCQNPFNVNVPEKVLTTFSDKYVNASVGYWEVIDGKYRVFYDYNQRFQYIIYDANANILETGIFTEKSAAPSNLVDMFLQKFNLLQHTETYVSNTSKGVNAYLLVGEDEENKHEMLVTEKGQIIRTYKQKLLTREQKAEIRKQLQNQETKQDKIQW